LPSILHMNIIIEVNHITVSKRYWDKIAQKVTRSKRSKV
jgi:hypothetical protein